MTVLTPIFSTDKAITADIQTYTLSSDNAHFAMNGQDAGGINVIPDESGLFDDITVTQNTDLDWTTTDTFLTPNTLANANAYTAVPTAAESAFLRQDTASAILVSWWTYVPTGNAAAHAIFSYGERGAAVNGWGVGIAGTEKIFVYSNTGANIASDSGVPFDQVVHCCAVLDVANATALYFIDGVADGSNEMTICTALPTTDKFSLMGRVTAANESDEYGETWASGGWVSNVRIIRFTTDQSANYATYAQALSTSRINLPPELDGV